MTNEKMVYNNTCYIVLIIPTTMASAETNKENIIENDNGVRMTSEQYDMLLPRFNAEEIAEMSQETFESYKDVDYREWESTTTTIYVETDTTAINGIPIVQTERQITEEEWDNIPKNTMQTNLTRGVSHETNAKKLTLNFLKSGNRRIIDLYNRWKTNPTVRSFDIIAIRWGRSDVFTVTNATGEQRGNNRLQVYSFNGSNMKRDNNGVGISMNLFDDDANITNTLRVEGTVKTDRIIGINGTYQHAITSTTLAQSHNYVFSDYPVKGEQLLGGTIRMGDAIANKFDKMQGVYSSFFTD